MKIFYRITLCIICLHVLSAMSGEYIEIDSIRKIESTKSYRALLKERSKTAVIKKYDLPNKYIFQQQTPAQEVTYRNDYIEYTKENIDNYDLIDSTLNAIPSYQEIKRGYLPTSKYVDMIISGGTWRPYSYAVAKNHAIFAQAREIKYKFIPYEYPLLGDEKNISMLDLLGDVQPYWGKVYLIKKFLDSNFVRVGQWISWIDDDIVIKDFGQDIPVFDKIIESTPENVCIITTHDADGIKNSNTGIVLVKKSDHCQRLIDIWLVGINDPRLAKQSQRHSLHEQEALTSLKKGVFSLDLSMSLTKFFKNKPINYTKSNAIAKKDIKLIPPRTQQWNINTFKRFDFSDEGRNEKYQIDFKSGVAAKPDDLYVHHTGMMLELRFLLIIHTLNEAQPLYPVIENTP